MESVATTTRSWRRPHGLAIGAAILTAAWLLFLNVPGSNEKQIALDTNPSTATNGREHGWPLVYLRRSWSWEPTSCIQVPIGIWSLNEDVRHFSPWMLAANCFIVVGFGAALGALVEFLTRWRQPRLRFGLRTALCSVGIVCALLAWMQSRVIRHHEQQAGIERLKGGDAAIAYREVLPEWARSIIGDQYASLLDDVDTVQFVGKKVTDQQLQELATFPQTDWLYVADASITDQGLRHVGVLTRLTRLSLVNVAISDEGLEVLRTQSQLKALDLQGMPIDGSGLKYLKDFDNLESISLHDTRIIDAALEHLVDLPRLKYVAAEGTQLTQAGIESFERRSRSRAIVAR